MANEETNWSNVAKVVNSVSQKTWLDILGFPQYNETVVENDIVRQVSIDPINFTIHYEKLWSFETNSQAKESLDYWYDQFAEYRKIHKNEI
jgi:hypothetical protein